MITVGMLKSIDKSDVKRIYSWAARVGLGPKYGSRSVSWYQMHHEALRDVIFDAAVKKGGKASDCLGTVTAIFDNKDVYLYPCNDFGRQTGIAVCLGDIYHFYSLAYEKVRGY